MKTKMETLLDMTPQPSPDCLYSKVVAVCFLDDVWGYLINLPEPYYQGTASFHVQKALRILFGEEPSK
jgi:hypothetical protein